MKGLISLSSKILKDMNWCVVCGRYINPLSRRWVTCGPHCRKRYKCGDMPYLHTPKANSLTEVALLADRKGLSYGYYVAQTERPVKIGCHGDQPDSVDREELTDMPMYVHCPFYKSDKNLNLKCEGGTIKLPDSTSRFKYMNEYCAHEKQWENCSLAKCLMEYNEREE